MKHVGTTFEGDEIISISRAEINLFCEFALTLSGFLGMLETEVQTPVPKAEPKRVKVRKVVKAVKVAKAKTVKPAKGKRQAACLVCGKPFIAKRVDSKFCSKACCKAHHNTKRYEKPDAAFEAATSTHACAACREPAPEGQRLCERCKASAEGMRKRIAQTTTGGGL